jgi:GTP diphosphokinase / guanosine-3',5'-bis(diphosphate) 3'-diphosphatase
MNTIKWELEDLSFATLYPKVYDEIVRLVAERAPAREEYLALVREQVGADLRAAKIKATVSGRPKHYYSIYQKMIVRGRDFADIYDLVGVRVLVESVRDCYAALGALHARWNPVPGRFKDYIAMPKFNLYQSLHTTVIGPNGKPVEIQIRTHDMHRRAEYGVAAHWKYKEVAKSSPQVTDAAGNDMAWLRQLVDWQKETSDPSEFLDSLRFEIAGAEVYVFTPKGDVISLPAGSTPVDFAYAVHTEVGHRTMGARVNGRLVPLDSTLENGDVVDVLTSRSETAGPSRDWLSFVKSPRARNKIRQWFSKERREEAIEHGKDAIAKAMRKQNLPIQRLLSHEALVALASEMRYADVSGLYAAIGEGQVSAATVVQRLVHAMGGEPGAEEDIAETARPGRTARRVRTGDPGVEVKGMDDIWVKLAKCCTPVPGDTIMGFVTRGSGVSVHRTDCVNVESLMAQPERVVDVTWTQGRSTLFLVQIQVEALDRSRLLSDVTRVLSDHHVDILSASVSTTRDRVAMSKFVFEMAEPGHLASLLAAVRKIDGVFDVYRLTGSRSPGVPSPHA